MHDPCRNSEKIESWKSVNENIYFWAHTLTDWKTNLWIGKSMVQTTFKMIFTNLNWFFDKKLYALVDIQQPLSS